MSLSDIGVGLSFMCLSKYLLMSSVDKGALATYAHKSVSYSEQGPFLEADAFLG